MASEESKKEEIPSIERVKGAVDQTVEKTQRGLGVARDKLHDVADQVGERVKKASGTVRDQAQRAQTEIRRGAERASEVAREKYGQAREQLKEGYTKVRKDLGELSQDVNSYVRDNPGKSVAIAAGVGFLIGLLVRGRGHGGREG